MTVLNEQGDSDDDDDDDDDDDSVLNFRPFETKSVASSSSIATPQQNNPNSGALTSTCGIGDNDDGCNTVMKDSSSKLTNVSSTTKQLNDKKEAAATTTPVQSKKPQEDPEKVALQRLKKENWQIPDIAHKITHPVQLQWCVRDLRKSAYGRKKKKQTSNSATTGAASTTAVLKGFEVFPCRIANDQEMILYEDELDITSKILVQNIGIHHRYKEVMESVGRSRLIRFDGIVQLPSDDDGVPNKLEDVCLDAPLSEEYIEGYRRTLKTWKLDEVEQWMEVIMLKRVLRSVQDKVANKIRTRQEESAAQAAQSAADMDDSAVQYIESLSQRPQVQHESAVILADEFDRDKKKKKERLRVGDLIHYFPPELMAVENNMVRNVKIIGIDPKNVLCVVLDNGRGLSKDARIRRVSRFLRGKMEPVQSPYDCDIEEYQLIKGGDMAVTGFGGMQRQAKALVAAQQKIRTEMKKLGFGDDIMYHKMSKRKDDVEQKNDTDGPSVADDGSVQNDQEVYPAEAMATTASKQATADCDDSHGAVAKQSEGMDLEVHPAEAMATTASKQDTADCDDSHGAVAKQSEGVDLEVYPAEAMATTASKQATADCDDSHGAVAKPSEGMDLNFTATLDPPADSSPLGHKRNCGQASNENKFPLHGNEVEHRGLDDDTTCPASNMVEDNPEAVIVTQHCGAGIALASDGVSGKDVRDGQVLKDVDSPQRSACVETDAIATNTGGITKSPSIDVIENIKAINEIATKLCESFLILDPHCDSGLGHNNHGGLGDMYKRMRGFELAPLTQPGGRSEIETEFNGDTNISAGEAEGCHQSRGDQLIATEEWVSSDDLGGSVRSLSSDQSQSLPSQVSEQSRSLPSQIFDQSRLLPTQISEQNSLLASQLSEQSNTSVPSQCCDTIIFPPELVGRSNKSTKRRRSTTTSNVLADFMDEDSCQSRKRTTTSTRGLAKKEHYLTKDQIEVVDQVLAVMEQRWGGPFPQGLESLMKELGVDPTLLYRVESFLLKDKPRVLRVAVHEETALILKAWLKEQGEKPQLEEESTQHVVVTTNSRLKEGKTKNPLVDKRTSMPKLSKTSEVPNQRKRRHSEAPATESRHVNKSLNRRTSAVEARHSSSSSTSSSPSSQMMMAQSNRTRRRGNTTHMSQEQLELADEVLGVMNRRWGDDLIHGVMLLENELGLDNYRDRLRKFLTKDENRLFRRCAHDETEGHLRIWLHKQRCRNAAAILIIKDVDDDLPLHKPCPDEISV